MTDTRVELLQAGVMLYSRLRSSHLQSLTAGRVAAAAGFHRQTFYRYWDTQAEYVQDLIRFALDGANDAAGEGISAGADGEPEPSEFEPFVRALARDGFARFRSDPMRDFRFALIATRGGTEEIDYLLDDSSIASSAKRQAVSTLSCGPGVESRRLPTRRRTSPLRWSCWPWG